MTHEREHVIIHKIKEAVNKPVTCKRWHLGALGIAGLILGFILG